MDRICAYRTCVQPVVTDCPTMLRDSVPASTNAMCPLHDKRMTDDLEWLASNLNELETIRLNRAYKTGGNSGGGGGVYGPSAPWRDSIAELLYGHDASDACPGVDELLGEWAKCLGAPLPPAIPLEQKAQLLAHDGKLHGNMATPVYAELLHRLCKRLERELSGDDGSGVLYGPCPVKDCTGVLHGSTDGEATVCDKCRTRMPKGVARAERVMRLLDADRSGRVADLCDLLATCGVKVKPGTVRQWANRGQLQPVGADADGKPVYRLSDVYRRATGLDADADIFDIMQTAGAAGE